MAKRKRVAKAKAGTGPARPRPSKGYVEGVGRCGSPRFRCLRCALAFAAESEIREHVRRAHPWPMYEEEMAPAAPVEPESPPPAAPVEPEAEAPPPAEPMPEPEAEDDGAEGPGEKE